jgi:hypothetical protein
MVERRKQNHRQSLLASAVIIGQITKISLEHLVNGYILRSHLVDSLKKPSKKKSKKTGYRLHDLVE